MNHLSLSLRASCLISVSIVLAWLRSWCSANFARSFLTLGSRANDVRSLFSDSFLTVIKIFYKIHCYVVTVW